MGAKEKDTGANHLFPRGILLFVETQRYLVGCVQVGNSSSYSQALPRRSHRQKEAAGAPDSQAACWDSGAGLTPDACTSSVCLCKALLPGPRGSLEPSHLRLALGRPEACCTLTVKSMV